MLVARVNCVVKNPFVLITGCFYYVCKYIFIFAFTKPSAFRVCGTTFDCFGILRDIIRKFLRIASGR